MFAIVHTEKFKLLYVVTDKRTKVNIYFVHDDGLNFDRNISKRSFKSLFSSRSIRYDQYR